MKSVKQENLRITLTERENPLYDDEKKTALPVRTARN